MKNVFQSIFEDCFEITLEEKKSKGVLAGIFLDTFERFSKKKKTGRTLAELFEEFSKGFSAAIFERISRGIYFHIHLETIIEL